VAGKYLEDEDKDDEEDVPDRSNIPSIFSREIEIPIKEVEDGPMMDLPKPDSPSSENRDSGLSVNRMIQDIEKLQDRPFSLMPSSGPKVQFQFQRNLSDATANVTNGHQNSSPHPKPRKFFRQSQKHPKIIQFLYRHPSKATTT
jgi:hypothetical protein